MGPVALKDCMSGCKCKQRAGHMRKGLGIASAGSGRGFTCTTRCAPHVTHTPHARATRVRGSAVCAGSGRIAAASIGRVGGDRPPDRPAQHRRQREHCSGAAHVAVAAAAVDALRKCARHARLSTGVHTWVWVCVPTCVARHPVTHAHTDTAGATRTCGADGCARVTFERCRCDLRVSRVA
jgi:hypothetical protein